ELATCIEADLTRHEQQRADAHEWNVVGDGACRRGQRNAEFGKLFLDRSGHDVLLRVRRRACLGRLAARMQASPARVGRVPGAVLWLQEANSIPMFRREPCGGGLQ